MSATSFLFQAPEGALTQWGMRTGGSLVSYFRSLPWSLIQLTVSENDFDFLAFLKRFISALLAEFNDFFDEATDDTTREDAIKVFRAVYKTPGGGVVTWMPSSRIACALGPVWFPITTGLLMSLMLWTFNSSSRRSSPLSAGSGSASMR